MNARRRTHSPALAAILLISASLLSACDDGYEAPTATPVPAPAPPPPAAETLLGADLLPPDDAIAIAAGLTAADLPPDAAATLADEDLAPAT